jgi:hypothetical protein
VSTQLFAQNAKEDVITIQATGSRQNSVSTSPTVANYGYWSDPQVPGKDGVFYYKTAPVKFTEQDLIHCMAYVLWGNAGHYSTTAKLVLDQGELSGFFGITPRLASSSADLDGIEPEGTFTSADSDPSTELANSFDSTGLLLASGRHMIKNPITGLDPVGHLQPWGQIWIKDSARHQYDNVTYFFAISVQECYDCFYMNSFISDATFKVQSTSQNGPPCCSTPTTDIGKGKDAYYVTLSFDDTINNPYLYPGADVFVGDHIGSANFAPYNYVVGIGSDTIPGDGIVPDDIGIGYSDPIRSGVGRPSPYESRFTLNGILTYTWNLAFVDKSDLSPDFLGTGKYVASGYGFIQLYCSLLNATVTFTEKAVRASTTVDALTGDAWSSSWYGVGAEYMATEAGGFDTAYDTGFYLVPVNVSTSLSFHENFDKTYPGTQQGFPSEWPHPGYVAPLFPNPWGLNPQ